MKRLTLVLFVVLVMAISVSAGNGEARTKRLFYLGGGVDIPLSPRALTDYWKMGIGIEAGFGSQVAPHMEVVGKLRFNSFSFDDDKFFGELGVVGGTVDGFDFRVAEFGVDIKYLLIADASLTPFITIGAGVCRASFTDVTVTAGEETVSLPMDEFSETQLAVSLGGGFDYMFSPRSGIWVDGRWMMAASSYESTAYFPIRIGLKVLLGE